ncbi:unnamed protein product [Arabis nemorensis]|uniref:ATPase AAA-type core domain-containing protein n=1 Tax=Arabis nemorensis TaxID=586526 RepID=A0A565C3G4_9BRAS|nr:unnamed protein product [Arabis nemorensis]
MAITWKRAYLLPGPPRRGKTSMITAMANYLKFDIYELDLGRVCSNYELSRLVATTSSGSIIVVEDIDC